MKNCVKLIIRGKVQGVGYRNAVYRKVCDQLASISGFVRNLPNGDVELVACAEPGDLKRVVTFAYEGSSHSKVDGVEVIELQASTQDLPSVFTIK